VSADRAWGALACGFYAIHAAVHISRGHPDEMFWACHLGALIVGIGLLLRRPAIAAIGFLWLCVGDVLYVISLIGGTEFLPTSLLTHGGGLAVGFYAVWRFGIPRHSWWRALLAFLVLQEICRLVTPPATNLNLAHAVWSGWEGVFPSYRVYQVILVTIAGASFAGIEWLARRVRPISPQTRS
jgi:hypothetical protein